MNGRKIVTEIVDDGGAANNLQASQDLVQNRGVFAVVNNSSFAFLSYRFLLEQGVPMVGGGFDGTYYGRARATRTSSPRSATWSPSHGVTCDDAARRS